MTVHSINVFDRKGKTLFTKRYAKNEEDEDDSDRQKLVFGMLFSLREVVGSLSPDNTKDPGIHSVQTRATTLYTFESNSGLRFALYMTNSDSNADYSKSVRAALKHIYNNLWINSVTRSPLYQPTAPNVAATNFEQNLDSYLASQSWFK